MTLSIIFGCLTFIFINVIVLLEPRMVSLWNWMNRQEDSDSYITLKEKILNLYGWKRLHNEEIAKEYYFTFNYIKANVSEYKPPIATGNFSKDYNYRTSYKDDFEKNLLKQYDEYDYVLHLSIFSSIAITILLLSLQVWFIGIVTIPIAATIIYYRFFKSVKKQ